jgi:hypothetical protein
MSLANADLANTNLFYADFAGAKNGTSANVTGALWDHTTCPDGSSSDNDGYTCVGHGF